MSVSLYAELSERVDMCLKANHVFDYLSVTRYYNGLVLMLEDDHYVVKDLIPVLHQMYRLRRR